MDELQQLQATMRGCRICLESGYDIVPGAVFQGKTGARALIIGQAPGVTEVEAKRPFNASSGRRLFQWLGEAGWEEDDFRARHYMTSVTKCYPGKHGNGKGDRVPTKAEQAFCRPYLEREIALINPVLIIPVGGLAIKLFYPASAKLKDIIGRGAYFPPETLVGNRVNFKLKQAERLAAFDGNKGVDGRWIVPLPHPSGASLWPNKPENKALIERAVTFLGDMREKFGL
jgi:uracil-DNA glycosylase